MHDLTHIYKVTIAVFFTAMVAVLCSTLTGCRGCSSEEEVVIPWVPAPQSAIPEAEVVVKDSLEAEPVVTLNIEPVVTEEIVAVTRPAKKKRPVSAYDDTYSDENQESHKPIVRSWPEELDVDSIELTIAVDDLEMQITQKFD
jgi:hypothetical protein